MTRMNLNLCGDPAAHEERFWTNFTILLTALIIYLIFDVSLTIAITATGTGSSELVFLKVLIRTAFAFYVLFATLKTRIYIRRKDNIPEEHCRGVEDCCISYWCTCCVIAQMARHTADYGIYGASCCTETGLVDYVPPTKVPPNIV